MKKRKILIVDDEKGFTETLKLYLEATDKYEVKVENDPSFAIYTAMQYHPDLILLDIIMPQMEGPDVAFEFKHHPALNKIPIVFLTATITKEEVVEQKGIIGGHAFVAKPSSLNDLIGTIEKSLTLV